MPAPGGDPLVLIENRRSVGEPPPGVDIRQELQRVEPAKRDSAICKTFQIKVVAFGVVLNRFAAPVHSRTAANGLSTTSVVRRRFQWASGCRPPRGDRGPRR